MVIYQINHPPQVHNTSDTLVTGMDLSGPPAAEDGERHWEASEAWDVGDMSPYYKMVCWMEGIWSCVTTPFNTKY